MSEEGKKNLRSRLNTTVAGKVKACDMLGQGVNLTFERDETYTTYHGAICSLICTIVFVIFCIMKTIKLVGGMEPNISGSFKPR